MVEWAQARLSQDVQARYLEEWHAHLDSLPNTTVRLWAALGFCIAAYRINAAALAARDPDSKTTIDDEVLFNDVIKRIFGATRTRFFVIGFDARVPCQGDVVKLEIDIPIFDSDRSSVANEGGRYWLVLGQSCDISRVTNTDSSSHIPIVPLIPMSSMKLDHEVALEIRKYQVNKLFYVPAWSEATEGYVADCTRTVALCSTILKSRAQVIARMRSEARSLLLACVTRLFYRADSRYTGSPIGSKPP
jgi:hypothetical protein